MNLLEKRAEILLFNPIHDKLGRFARKAGSGVSSAVTAVTGETGKNILKGAAGGAALRVAGEVMWRKLAGGGSTITDPVLAGGSLVGGTVQLRRTIKARKEAQGKITRYESRTGKYATTQLNKARMAKTAAEMQLGANIVQIGVGALGVSMLAYNYKKGTSVPSAWREGLKGVNLNPDVKMAEPGKVNIQEAKEALAVILEAMEGAFNEGADEVIIPVGGKKVAIDKGFAKGFLAWAKTAGTL